MTTYEIFDGVRRARAYYEAGITTIEAEVEDQPGVVVQIPIDFREENVQLFFQLTQDLAKVEPAFAEAAKRAEQLATRSSS